MDLPWLEDQVWEGHIEGNKVRISGEEEEEVDSGQEEVGERIMVVKVMVPELRMGWYCRLTKVVHNVSSFPQVVNLFYSEFQKTSSNLSFPFDIFQTP